MKSNKEIPEELFDIILVKNYHELSADQKQRFDPFLTELEYDDMRESLLLFQEEKEDVEIPAFNFQAPKQKKASAIVQFLNKKIPLYQVAAVGLLMMLFVWGVDRNGFNVNSSNLASNQVEKLGKSLAIDDYPEQIIFNY